MKLGQNADTFYGIEKSTKDRMIYPEVSLPAQLFDKAYKVGDKCVVEFTGTIENMGKDQYRIKLIEGKEVETPAEDKKEESLLKRAK